MKKKKPTNARPIKRRLIEFTTERTSGMRADSWIISARSLQTLAACDRKAEERFWLSRWVSTSASGGRESEQKGPEPEKGTRFQYQENVSEMWVDPCGRSTGPLVGLQVAEETTEHKFQPDQRCNSADHAGRRPRNLGCVRGVRCAGHQSFEILTFLMSRCHECDSNCTHTHVRLSGCRQTSGLHRI